MEIICAYSLVQKLNLNELLVLIKIQNQRPCQVHQYSLINLQMQIHYLELGSLQRYAVKYNFLDFA